MPNSTMTNGAVTRQVQKVEGNTLQLKYKEGEKTIVVPNGVVIVNLVPGDKADEDRSPRFHSALGEAG